MTLQIRAARREDRDWIVASQVAMAKETEGLALDPPTVRQGVLAVLEDPLRGTYWIAEEGERPLGMLLTLSEWSDWRNGTVLWIHSVWVEPDARRKGIFRALYGHLVAMVKASPQLRGLRLYVDRRNTAAQKVYQELGMDGEHYRLYEWMDPGERRPPRSAGSAGQRKIAR